MFLIQTDEIINRMTHYLEAAQEKVTQEQLYHAKLPLNSLISLYTIYESTLRDTPDGYNIYRRGIELLAEINAELGNHRGVLICQRLLHEY